jgi:hypothetical protein
MNIVAERAIDCDGVAGRISIYAPQPDQNDSRCEYELAWPGYHRRSYAMGIDSFQSLQLAMSSAVVDVAASNDFKGGRLGALGGVLTTIDDLKQFFGMSRIPGFEP